jgi:hypothetical protein
VRSTPPPAVVRLFTYAESSGPVCRVRIMPPPAVMRLFTSAESSGSASGTGAWAHESCSLGVDLCVGEGEPPREEHTTAYGGVSLHLR